MRFEIILDNKNIEVQLINKNNIRHCYLALKSSNLIQIRAHMFFNMNDAKALINKKEQWLVKNIKKLQQKEITRNKDYYLGNIIDNIQDIDVFYKQKAEELLPDLVQKHGQRMGLYPTRLSFRKNKTRFGSCSSKNAISLNTLLMRYPIRTIEYVIVHELAHIKHKNHSKQFWSFVELYCPDYKKLDASLKMF